MQKLLVCRYVGQNQGVGVGGKGGIWNSSQVTVACILLWVRIWDCGGGVMMGLGRVVGKGVGRGFNWSFELKQVSLHLVWLSECILRDEISRNCDFGGFPQFLTGNPHVMTSHSRKNVTFSLRKWEGERFHLITYARRSSHLGKLKKMPHFEISNSNIKAIRQPIRPKLEIWAILRWI